MRGRSETVQEGAARTGPVIRARASKNKRMAAAPGGLTRQTIAETGAGMKYMVIGAVALAVLFLARGGKAETKTNSMDYMGNPRNWDYMPGYQPGTGLML